MHTSDESDPSETKVGDTKGREAGPSNTSPADTAADTATNTDTPADSDIKAEPARCGAIRRRTGEPCKNFAIRGGRCRWHVVDEVVPADEREALRQLQEAAAQHALDAYHAVEGGDNGDKDEEFNRNARTAAHLARIRQALVGPGEMKGEGEKTQVVMIENHRDDAAPADSAPAAPESSEGDRDDGDDKG
jgi:hypothetical protein